MEVGQTTPGGTHREVHIRHFISSPLCPSMPGTLGGRGTEVGRSRFGEEVAAKNTWVAEERAEAAAPAATKPAPQRA